MSEQEATHETKQWPPPQPGSQITVFTYQVSSKSGDGIFDFQISVFSNLRYFNIDQLTSKEENINIVLFKCLGSAHHRKIFLASSILNHYQHFLLQMKAEFELSLSLPKTNKFTTTHLRKNWAKVYGYENTRVSGFFDFPCRHAFIWIILKFYFEK